MEAYHILSTVCDIRYLRNSWFFERATMLFMCGVLMDMKMSFLSLGIRSFGEGLDVFAERVLGILISTL
jgi:hypothetical protein